MSPANLSRSRILSLAPTLLTAAAMPRSGLAADQSIRVGVTPSVAGAISYYAQELGFFRRAGLDVSLTMFSRSVVTMEAIQTGNPDLAQGAPIALAAAIARGLSLRLVGCGALYTSEVGAVRLCVLSGSPIRTAADLEGRTIAVSSLGDVSTLGIFVWLDKNGVDHTKIKFIELPFAAMALALQRGTIQAAEISEPFLSTSRDVVRIIPGVYETIAKRWAVETWYSRSDFAAANGALVRRFMSSIYATSKFVNANPRRVEDLLASFSKIPLDTVKTMLKVSFAESFDPTLLQPELDLAYQYKQLPKPITVREMTGEASRT